MHNQLKDHLRHLVGSTESINLQRVSGGDISNAFKITLKNKSYFLKVNSAKNVSMFNVEVVGLKELSKTLETPEVIAHGVVGPQSFLLLSWIESGIKTNDFWSDFGEKLATLHSNNSDRFGFHSDNYIASLVQANNENQDWAEFFSQCRISPLVKIAFDKGLLNRKHLDAFNALNQESPSLFPNAKPSLLHGDLWSGNFLCNRVGSLVLIDPAVYYGHPEMELAFTTMFGGFSQTFYESYFSVSPQIPGFSGRIEVYNLYPTLVHLILFGSSYLAGIESVLRRFNR